MRTALERLACAASELNTGCDAAQAMERLDLFHSMKIVWKHCRKMLENLISIVLSHSIVWKYSILEIKLDPAFPVLRGREFERRVQDQEKQNRT